MTETAVRTKVQNVLEEVDEDKELKEELQLLVAKLVGNDHELYGSALEMLRNIIRTSTTSMTSVPKPLKYLSGHYLDIKNSHERIKDDAVKKLCADIISVLAMGTADNDSARANRDCLHYCLLGTMKDVGDWGHEYIRQLESEIVEEWTTKPSMCKKILPLVENVVKFDATHHAEIQACDMLMEIDKLDIVFQHLNKDTYSRVCHYLTSCAKYVEDMERARILLVVYRQYMVFKEYLRAFLTAMQMDNIGMMTDVFKACDDSLVLKQMAFIAGRQQISIPLTGLAVDQDELSAIMSNIHMNSYFISLARELDIMEPKNPEDVYKSWLEPTPLRPTLLTDHIDSARQNLASSFVNAFVNAGFSQDGLVTVESGNKWIYRNKDHGMLSATASLGLIHLWDVDGGLTPIDKYLYTNEDHVKAGALLALGIVNCKIRNDCDPALALLSDYVVHTSPTLQVGAIFGLGLAYVGSKRRDVLDLLIPVVADPSTSIEVLAITSISCGMVFVGSCEPDITSTILQRLIEGNTRLITTHVLGKLVALGLGLCFLGCREAIEATSATLEVLDDPFQTTAQIILQMCAYAGTGDVLIVQELLRIYSDTQPQDDVSNIPSTTAARSSINSGGSSSRRRRDEYAINRSCDVQAVAALGTAIIAMGEEAGSEMSSRIFGHMGRYGEGCMRKAVPLALAMCSVSNPTLTMLDILNKYSHDSDDQVSYNAIFALGLVGAGSNNARLATMLRQLAGYHYRNPNHLFMVRLAQGLTHLGKGTMTLSPFYMDRQIMDQSAMAGLLVMSVAMMDSFALILGKLHYLLYALVAAMQPRWLITVDENMQQLPVSVRVGQAVDVVAKAGTPKTITGIHTHTTPVLLSVGERCELATDQYSALSPMLEGIVILKAKPDSEKTS